MNSAGVYFGNWNDLSEDENGEEDTEALNRVHDDDYLKIEWKL